MHSVDDNGEVHERVTSNTCALPDVDLLVRHTPRGMEAVLERSLPTLVRGHNITSLDASEAVEAIRYLYEQAAEVVDWADDLGALRITRLDLDRDFTDVTALSPLLYNLARLPARRTHTTRLHVAPGGAVGLERATPSRTWRALLYDKQAQIEGLASVSRQRNGRVMLTASPTAMAVARVRFEVQLHRDTLHRKGIRTVSDLDHPTRLDEVSREFFRRVRFDTPVGGPSHLEEVHIRLATSGDTDYKFLGQVMGMLHADALGLPPPSQSPTTIARYRALALKWGLSAADVLAQTAGSAMAFDYASGRVRAA
ncbi:hypothetical protein [Cellulomonas composti]|uniref:Uncharacterized protein n=1 Tax=Cellulomonas composti TaxID=266130 RepID=A0A511JBD2_9CELL|nr:hypothetical protein [Cellulomonas composti]GEL95296.1 hypothetical protein CCO02nite_19540 [Cellulomonas composti]